MGEPACWPCPGTALFMLCRKKSKEKTTPFGVCLTRSLAMSRCCLCSCWSLQQKQRKEMRRLHLLALISTKSLVVYQTARVHVVCCTVTALLTLVSRGMDVYDVTAQWYSPFWLDMKAEGAEVMVCPCEHTLHTCTRIMSLHQFTFNCYLQPSFVHMCWQRVKAVHS